MSRSAHVPHRPTWRCSGCLRPWPCPVARTELLEEYADTPASLAIYLDDMASWAQWDLLGTGTAIEVRRRITGWVASAQPEA